VAAGLAPLALGTQTIGSIIRPAGFCGVLGFKPSRERISRQGVIPLSASLDHVGFFAADIQTACAAAAVLFEDWGGLPDPSATPVLGVPQGPYLEQAEPEALEHFWNLVERMASAGYRSSEFQPWRIWVPSSGATSRFWRQRRPRPIESGSPSSPTSTTRAPRR
jgi:Asp-tRNA(Asn)/Glu-tRNA(Gln) amidotransferase A subunit family amidase